MSEPIPIRPVQPSRSISIATILLAVDDLDVGTGAIRVAVQLAADTGAQLIVLSVLPVSEGYGLMGLDARAVEEDKARSMVERIASEAGAAGIKARAHTTQGASPAEAIAAAARDLNANVIVVGRRGRSDLARAMLGDVTARVIGLSSSPVLVVPRAAAYTRKRILLATDGSPASERAARTAALCAKLVRLPVTVVSVEAPDHPAERQAEASKIVERTVAGMRGHGIDASGSIGHGQPPDEIIAAASASGADLIVIGSDGRSGFDRMMLGSNCQEVIGKSTCPVLVTTAKMPDAPPPKPRPQSVAARRPEPEPAPRPQMPARRTFLVVADDTEEMSIAIDYACRRAHATGGTVALLRIISSGALEASHDGQQSLGEVERQARELLDRTASQIERVLGEAPKSYLRWGDASQQLLELLASEPSINALVLAASPDPRGPGPLIIDLVTKHAAALPIPLMIVPGHFSGRLA